MISMTESEEGSPRQEISELKDFYRTKEPEQKKSIKRALTETEQTVLNLSLGTKNEEGRYSFFGKRIF